MVAGPHHSAGGVSCAGDAADRLLAHAGWAAARRQPVAGDASTRRFLRLSQAGETAILMIDDGPDGGASAQFVRLARWLRAQGFAAPAILAEETGRGLVLVEDLGTRVAAAVAAEDPDREQEIYKAAGRVLAKLAQAVPPDGLTRLDSAGLGRLSSLAWEWYAPVGRLTPPDAQRMGDAVATALARFDGDGCVMSLRDFHAENIVWREDRDGLSQVGLVDFQDAVLAHPVYDLVSLVQDARRDVGAGASQAAIRQFCLATGRDPAQIGPAMAAVGAARALRILGIFARLALRDGKTRYLPMIPRVWKHLVANLSDPALATLREGVLATLPVPDASVLARMTRQAGRHPSAAIVFAAGLGTRMRPLTDTVPKPLVAAGGRPLIDHALDATRACGVDRVVVNVHHLAPMIRRHLDGRDSRIAISDECDRLLDTGGGLKRALPLLGTRTGPVFTLNSDAVWLGPVPLAVLRSQWDPDRMEALLLLVPAADMIGHNGAGDFVMASDGALRRGPGLVYTGAGIIAASAVAAEDAEVFSLNRVWDGLQAAGRLFGTLYPGRLVDVGRPQSISLADAAVAQRAATRQDCPTAGHSS